MTLYKYTMYVYTKTLNKYELLNFTYPIVFCPVLWYYSCGPRKEGSEPIFFGELMVDGKRGHTRTLKTEKRDLKWMN